MPVDPQRTHTGGARAKCDDDLPTPTLTAAIGHRRCAPRGRAEPKERGLPRVPKLSRQSFRWGTTTSTNESKRRPPFDFCQLLRRSPAAGGDGEEVAHVRSSTSACWPPAPWQHAAVESGRRRPHVEAPPEGILLQRPLLPVSTARLPFVVEGLEEQRRRSPVDAKDRCCLRVERSL